MIKTISKKNTRKNAKWLSEEVLQIAEKREVKGKGEKERYSHLNAEFPAIPLLGICTEKTMILKDTCTPVFTVALFTTAGTWNQPRCPLTYEWIKKLWYI